MTRRVAPFARVALRDEDWEVDLAEEKHPDQRGYVVATRALTDEPWVDVAPGALVVFRAGELVHGG